MAKKIDPALATPGEWRVMPTHMTMHDGSRLPTFAIVATGTPCEPFVGRAHPKSGEPDERPIVEMDARLFAGSKGMATLLLQAMAYEEEAFTSDAPVDGGDLVAWFSGWREDVRRLLEAAATQRA